MRLARIFALLGCSLPGLFALDEVSHQEYAGRRAELRKALHDGVTILFGATEQERGELRTGFFQEPNFYYLTGWKEPGAILVMTPAAETFLIPKRYPEREKWTGRKLAAGDSEAPTVTGFAKVLAAESFETELPRLLETSAKVYLLPRCPRAEAAKALLALRQISDVGPAIAKLRMKKSPAELQLIQRATDVTMEAHRIAWKRMAPGLYEYQIAAAMAASYFEKGCERHAYAPIVGSGPNGAVLHYARNSRRMDAGEAVVMDVGAECSMYAADITRTVPVNGRFNKRQRELYHIVLGAQKAAIAAVKPGMMLSRTAPNSLHKIALDYINTHGKDLHGNPLGKYFTHGLGHHVGLEVHDANDPAIPLEPGMVITIEPGIYIPEEGIGIRIEDMVLVTENGAKVLSVALPRELEDVERAVAAK
jgi:Xaa-Pro aminopeptidase